MESAVERSRLRAPERQIVLHVPSDLPPVDADPRRLAQVLDNLLDNASKYATAGPIAVSGATPGHVLSCTIEQIELVPPGFTALVPGIGAFPDSGTQGLEVLV